MHRVLQLDNGIAEQVGVQNFSSLINFCGGGYSTFARRVDDDSPNTMVCLEIDAII